MKVHRVGTADADHQGLLDLAARRKLDRWQPPGDRQGRNGRGKGTSLNSTSLTPKSLASSVYVHVHEAPSPKLRSISVMSLFPFRSDSYRLERPTCRVGIAPTEDQHLFTAHTRSDLAPPA